MHHRGTGETLEISHMHVAGGGGGLPGNTNAGGMQITSFVRPRREQRHRRQQDYHQHRQQQHKQRDEQEKEQEQGQGRQQSTSSTGLDTITSSGSLEHVDVQREQHVGGPDSLEAGADKNEDEGLDTKAIGSEFPSLQEADGDDGDADYHDDSGDSDDNDAQIKQRFREKLRQHRETKKLTAGIEDMQGAGGHREMMQASETDVGPVPRAAELGAGTGGGTGEAEEEAAGSISSSTREEDGSGGPGALEEELQPRSKGKIASDHGGVSRGLASRATVFVTKEVGAVADGRPKGHARCKGCCCFGQSRARAGSDFASCASHAFAYMSIY